MIFDIDRLNASNGSRKETVVWCTQATREFLDTAQQIGTKPFTRNSKYSYSPLTKGRKALFRQTVEFYVIMLNSKFDDPILGEDYAAAIRLDNGEIYFNGHISTVEEVGEVIAECCGYIKEIAINLFESALCGEPWDDWYANQQVEKHNDPHISITGNGNIISGGNVTKL